MLLSSDITLDCDADVLFIIDYSASMASKYDATLQIIQDIIASSNITDTSLQYGIIITGGTNVYVIRSFSTITR